MYGVILWSDPDVRKAVIWCEDGGYLAYYEAPDDADSASAEFFTTGDYIEFDMLDTLEPRRACNAHTLRSAHCSRVTRTLQAPGNLPGQPDRGEGSPASLEGRRQELRPTPVPPEISLRRG